MVTKILDHLYLGDWNDAQKFDGTIICVMQDILSVEPKHAYWIPIIRTTGGEIDYDKLIDDQDLEVTALPHQLMIAGVLINMGMDEGDVLVHCMAGIERSPLTIVYYLKNYKGYTWDDAYKFVQDKRPEVANRLSWLNMTYDERMS